MGGNRNAPYLFLEPFLLTIFVNTTCPLWGQVLTIKTLARRGWVWNIRLNDGFAIFHTLHPNFWLLRPYYFKRL